jgi:hypothetical protein
MHLTDRRADSSGWMCHLVTHCATHSRARPADSDPAINRNAHEQSDANRHAHPINGDIHIYAHTVNRYA